MSLAPPKRPQAVLVGVQLPDVTDEQHAANMAELARLVHTLGYDTPVSVNQKRGGLSGLVLGTGKLKELARITGGTGTVASGAADRTSKAKEKWLEEEAGPEEEEEDAEQPVEVPDDLTPSVVVVDVDLSPSQLRNLEQATGLPVLDRSGVIVDIFHRHARSREARMQVEVARLNYLAPRLRETGGRSERQAGRGSGDSALELDRRKIRDRLAELKEGLAAIAADQENRRWARRDQLRVALVGYTNAGKSSLMRALTGSEVLVADQLFATLDTTVRALQPESRPRILVSDTVGFIQKLPHDLVASFRSTLDEALEASLLLYVVDASDPTFEAQLNVTRTVLSDIGASEVPSRLVLNKADRLDAAQRAALLKQYPDALILSAHAPADVAGLRQTIIDFFEAQMTEADLVIPYSGQSRLGEIYEQARVVSETFDETGRRMTVRALPGALAKLVSAFKG
ncbi:MAG: GTPase HflX [Myxococcaceae bacterium]|nr:GTPase HflX [Myxococcaceae bacterium]